jgi:DNA-binding HxlR family transcriptional regulator
VPVTDPDDARPRPRGTRPNLDRSRCASRHALELIADTWTVLVVRALQDGPERYEALRRRIQGVSKRMLTLTLRNLEQNGLVQRSVFDTVPPQVEYRLTPLGETLREPIRALASWAEDHMDDVRAAHEDAAGGDAAVSVARAGS